MTYGETAEQAAASVKRSLSGNVRIASPEDFRGTFLPIPPDNGLDRALSKVKQDLYDKDLQRWKKFPIGKKESEFYQPFQEVAEAVNQASRDFSLENSIHTTWLDRHSRAPDTKSKDAAAIRPDIVQVSVSTHKDFDKLDEQILQNTANKENELKVWWMHIHTVVEIKPTPQDSEKLHDTIIQLCCYIRQLFREQLDRRFAIALLLCGSELTLWYCDRVGLVGTIDPINIHAHPDEFMKVLAAFSTLPADKLGWDPTMKLYKGKAQEPSPSYLISHAPNTGLHGLNWCISMPNMPTENNHSREDFITVRAITTPVFQHMCSRASIVWEVVKKEDFENGNSKASVFVLKQAWQPSTSDSGDSDGDDDDNDARDADDDKDDGNSIDNDGVDEVKMHIIGRLYASRFHSHETVRNEKGEAVSTDFFRISLTVETYANAVQKLMRGRGNDESGRVLGKRMRAEGEEPFAFIKLQEVTNNILNVREGAIRQYPRTLVRQLLKKFGYPLKCFIDNLELITVIRDAVKDHEDLYQHGVLHRDVSEGNILICDDDEPARVDHGMLIDLDHAKYTRRFKEDHDIKIFKAEDVDSLKHISRSLQFHELTDEIYQKALQLFPLQSAVVYLGNKMKSLPESLRKAAAGESKWNEDVFKWPKDLKSRIPDYSNARARPGLELTGTIPFISVELLNKQYLQYEKKGIPIHNSVHDMESFFWVLVHHCLTRDGNTGNRRKDLSNKSSNLSLYIKKLFSDEPDCHMARLNCFISVERFGTLLGCVDSYFSCLKDLLEKWYWLLLVAYNWDGVEFYNIHHCILMILNETIEELKQQQSYDNTYNIQAYLKAKHERQEKWKDWRSRFGVPMQVRQDEEEHPDDISLADAQEDDDMESSDVPPSPTDSPSAKRRRQGHISRRVGNQI